MELVLNIVWSIVALSAFVAYLRIARSSPGQTRLRHVQALCMLGCCLVLLFPVISASDDLHPTEAVAEDSVKRALSSPSAQLLLSAPPVASIVGQGVASILNKPTSSEPLALGAYLPDPAECVPLPHIGRAPPFLV